MVDKLSIFENEFVVSNSWKFDLIDTKMSITKIFVSSNVSWRFETLVTLDSYDYSNKEIYRLDIRILPSNQSNIK